MPGPCAECGRVCYQQADDGNFYCDACWEAWTRGSNTGPASKSKRAQDLEAKEIAKKAVKELKAQAYWKARQQVQLPQQLEASSESPLPVAFWGICDLKYDPRLPEKDRIKILELGDGRSSRFSHHGAAIKEKFDALFCMDSNPIKRAVMVENKKLTHDTFVECGLSCLRPLQFSYPRRYARDLASRIVRDLQSTGSESSAVVLKLVNRSRGAGVVVCPLADLDATLQQLLLPPASQALDRWLQEHAPNVLTEDRSADFLGEHKLHFWANECPVFVVEELCHSVPVQTDAFGAAEEFDGTLRVAFALRHNRDAQGKFDIDWLGGYWKLPSLAVSRGATGRMQDMHHQLVSSFNSEDKRTAEVVPEHLREVCRALTPALLAVFEAEPGSAKDIMNWYPDDENFRAFLLARYCATMRSSPADVSKSSRILDQAKKVVKVPQGRPSAIASELPERSVLSYIERTKGVNAALCADWEKANEHFTEALRRLPTNSSAHYLQGLVLEEKEKWRDAADCHRRAMVLDPDFRSPIMSLGQCFLHLGLHEDAVSACLACLHRQPDAPIAQHTMGQAIYQQLRKDWQGPEVEAAELRRKALTCLEIAKVGFPQRWSTVEEEIVAYLQAGSEREELPRQPVKMWKQYGWRP